MRISDWSSDVCSSDLQYYQAIRRFWRFGQSKPVNCHIIAAETEGATVSNIRRKEADADRMAAAMVKHMADLSSAALKGSARDTPKYNPSIPVILPKFMAASTCPAIGKIGRAACRAGVCQTVYT